MKERSMKGAGIRSVLLAALLVPGVSPDGPAVLAQTGWSPRESGTTATLNGIAWIAPPGSVRVVGDSNTFIVSDDDGATWRHPQKTPVDADLKDLVFPLPDTGYVVGDSGGSGVIYRAVRTGEQYTFTRTDTGAPCPLNSVSAVSQTVVGMAAGECGTMLRTTTRGQSWVPRVTGVTRSIRSVIMVTVANISACGDSGLILRSNSGGSSWVTQSPPGGYETTRFNSITSSGYLGDTLIVVGADGAVLRSRNAGSSWQPLVSGVTVDLRMVRHLLGTYWVVGDSGTILKSTDTGNTWTIHESGTSANLMNVFFIDPQHGCIVGENGTILYTSTGGEYLPVSVAPVSVDFGPVIVGSTKEGLLTLRNSSPVPVDVTLADPANMSFTVTPSAATIPAGGKYTFIVGYSPTATSHESSIIDIGGDSGRITLTVPVSGWGVDSTGESGWTWLNPLPQGNPLRDVGFFNPLEGIAVGEAGTIIRTADGGASWTSVHAPVGTEPSLSALEIIDADKAIAVGEYGAMFRTSDRGMHWSARSGPGPVEHLLSVSFAGTDTGFVTAWNGLWMEPGSVYKTTDGGSTWDNPVQNLSAFSSQLASDIAYDIAASTPELVLAVGWRASSSASGTMIFRSTDGGLRWDRLYTATYLLSTVAFIGESTAVCAGQAGALLRTTNGGFDWSTVSPAGFYDNIVDIAFSGPSNGIGVCGTGGIVRTQNGGVTWAPVAIGGVGSWSAVSFASPGLAMAIGYAIYPFHPVVVPDPVYTGKQPALYSSTDQGTTWTMSPESATSHTLRTVSFRDVLNGVAVSERGDILRTIDGGANWTRPTDGSLLASVGHPLTSVSYVPPDNITVVGMYGTVLRSTDGGMSWTEQSSGTTSTLLAVKFLDQSVGYIVGAGGTILRTEDGGDHWVSQQTSFTGELRGVDLVDGSDVFVVGAGIMIRTTDGGRHWNRPAGDTPMKLYDIAFRGDTGIAVGDRGALLVTTNGGNLWVNTGTDTTLRLLGVSLPASGLAVAVGEGGTILRSTDAGSTWGMSPSGTRIMLYDVAFVNDMVGTVVGGAGLILRTTTGGFASAGLTDVSPATFPATFRLDQNYPNPFNPSTTIRYSLPAPSRVVLRVYDLLGRVVATLTDGVEPAGDRSVSWDARGLASGVYVYRLEATGLKSPGKSFTREIKMVLVR